MPRLTGLADHSQAVGGAGRRAHPHRPRFAGEPVTRYHQSGRHRPERQPGGHTELTRAARARPSLLRVPLARIGGRIPSWRPRFSSGSRGHGAHYPSDVAAGFVLGATVRVARALRPPLAGRPGGRFRAGAPTAGPLVPRRTPSRSGAPGHPGGQSGVAQRQGARRADQGATRPARHLGDRTHRRRRRGAGDAARGDGGRGAGGGRPRRHRGGCGRDRPGRRHSIGGLSRRHLQPFRQGARPRPRASRDPSRPQGHGDQDGRRPRQRQAVSQHRERGRLQRLRGPPPTARRFVEQSWCGRCTRLPDVEWALTAG